jgi:hypothetical protein
MVLLVLVGALFCVSSNLSLALPKSNNDHLIDLTVSFALQVTKDLPEAFSLLGFAFYLQPLMMPIIREMPEGRTGRNALSAAVHASVLGGRLGRGLAS